MLFCPSHPTFLQKWEGQNYTILMRSCLLSKKGGKKKKKDKTPGNSELYNKMSSGCFQTSPILSSIEFRLFFVYDF